jgi:hypothetical protein
VWGVLGKDQPIEMQRATLQLLARLGRRQSCISQVVLDEIAGADEDSRNAINDSLRRHSPVILDVSGECRELAIAYLEAGVLPAKKREDALHVAISTVHEINVLVSWNHKHLANVRKTELYRGVNLMRGYSHSPAVPTPYEVLHG